MFVLRCAGRVFLNSIRRIIGNSVDFDAMHMDLLAVVLINHLFRLSSDHGVVKLPTRDHEDQ